ncbi:MAG: hypothetical protein M3Q83_00770 [Pseudomonadota bacterium]|nr:hypothetical protein [Pseudomonadota bacterium]
MAINQAYGRPAPSLASAHLARIAATGSIDHPHVAALSAASGREAARDLADAVHLLCSLYGRHPGLVELALHQCPAGPVRDWLRASSDAFERERLYLVRLTSAVGPLPSTPGSAETEAALSAQRRAIETLALSERHGCALGATTALVTDWAAVRQVLDRAATRMGVDVPSNSLPGDGSIGAVIDGGIDGPAASRALGFGAEQLLLQHRGLFDLLEARATARL